MATKAKKTGKKRVIKSAKVKASNKRFSDIVELAKVIREQDGYTLGDKPKIYKTSWQNALKEAVKQQEKFEKSKK